MINFQGYKATRQNVIPFISEGELEQKVSKARNSKAKRKNKNIKKLSKENNKFLKSHGYRIL